MTTVYVHELACLQCGREAGSIQQPDTRGLPIVRPGRCVACGGQVLATGHTERRYVEKSSRWMLSAYCREYHHELCTGRAGLHRGRPGKHDPVLRRYWARQLWQFWQDAGLVP